jgi:RNA polymerase sigma factor (sigma-70 family)
MMSVESCAATAILETTHVNAVIQQELKADVKGRVTELYPDEAILSGLKDQDMFTIKYVYKKFYQPVRHMVTSNSGTDMDAEDIFQDALVVIYKKVREGELKLTCSFNTYLFSICRHLWLQKLTRVKSRTELKDYRNLEGLEDVNEAGTHLEENERFNLFRKHLARLSEDDRKMLELFLKKVPLAEIARIMGYNSYDYAKVRKYLVKEKLKNSILNDPEYRKMMHTTEMMFAF